MDSLLCILLLSFVKAETTVDFDDFIAAYSKSYAKGTAEYDRRKLAFEESLKRHEILNSRRRNDWDAVYGVNQFSDLTPKEFAEGCLGSVSVSKSNSTIYESFLKEMEPAGKIFDWRSQGKVTPIRNQKQCGSCWAFSVVETIESGYAIQYNTTPVPLSPEQLISCDTAKAHGCKGGDIEEAMSWVQTTNETVVPESSYPFTSGDGKDHDCRTNLPNKGVKVLQYDTKKYTSNEALMVSKLENYGPLSIAVDASSWQDYISGIIQHHCPGVFLDHAVQIVGYNFEGPVPYWIVRNTWGTSWGLDGYVYIKYDDNLCGVAEQVVWVVHTEPVNLP